MVYVNVCVLRHFKQELAWTIDKWLQVISGLKQLYHQETKNKSVLNYNNIVCTAMWPLVTQSNYCI